jgi:hypothetical protein
LRRFPSNLQSSSKLWKDISSAMSSVVSVMFTRSNQTQQSRRRMKHIFLGGYIDRKHTRGEECGLLLLQIMVAK